MRYECSHRIGKKCHHLALYIATNQRGSRKQICEEHRELYKDLGYELVQFNFSNDSSDIDSLETLKIQNDNSE